MQVSDNNIIGGLKFNSLKPGCKNSCGFRNLPGR